ncbi:MAG TPA: phenylalanine--tRNA ligase subunit alpha [Egibacteraceae bacterium]|nr:phenylalanine--tRNA ligase subunit alpha [Actinomycetota bacterium]HWB72131.1 phenylalanine--tRNA ligase subunit alpha [Egibacteraceae bacterium]
MTEHRDLERLLEEALAAIAAASSLEQLDAARAAYLGKRGAVTVVQRDLGRLDSQERRRVGAQVNALRAALQDAEGARRAELESERDRVTLAAEAIDVTLPPRTPKRGSLHPVHETMEAIVDVFTGLGYTVATGPEVESDWFNFDALNMPADHPARSLFDTIYVHPLTPGHEPREDGTTDLLLRCHTSPVQARVMLARPPPVYVVVPGRTFRQDTPDATHLPVFHQVEGLAVDTDLSFADLRGTLAEFARALFGPKTKVRLRPSYFPFTEPSCELDAFMSSGQDGRWIELLGAGMVHPNVLRQVGYEPEEVRGFAWGMGVERVAMLRHGISDLRLLVENDLRFLCAF